MNENQKGFTLIELLIYISLVGIVSAGILLFYQSQLKANQRQNILTEMYQNARTALYFMETELQMAGFHPDRYAGGTSNSSGPLTGILDDKPDSVKFSYITESSEVATVEYSVSGGDLIRSTDSGSQIIANGIQTLGVDQTNNADNSISVAITIVANTSRPLPGRSDLSTREFITEVKCRNIGL